MAHFGPEDGAGIMGRVYALPHGRASILFALVAGVGIALLSAAPERRFDARLRLFWLAMILLPMGLMLQDLDHPVAVILQHYAAFFILGLCVLDVPRQWLLGLAAAMTLIEPGLFLAGRMTLPDVFDRDTVFHFRHPLDYTGRAVVCWSLSPPDLIGADTLGSMARPVRFKSNACPHLAGGRRGFGGCCVHHPLRGSCRDL